MRGFWHVAFLEGEQAGWYRIVKEQLAAINESKVACSTEEIHIEAIGPPHHLDRLHDLEWYVVGLSRFPSLF